MKINKKNVLIFGMLSFVVIFYASLFLVSHASVRRESPVRLSEPVRDAVHDEDRLTPSAIREKEQRFAANISSHPRLLAAVFAAFFFALAGGFVIEAVWIVRALRKRPVIDTPGHSFAIPPWEIQDVIHVFVGLFFVEAVLLCMELIVSTRVVFGSGLKDFFAVFNGFVRDAAVLSWILYFVTRVKRKPLTALGLTSRDLAVDIRRGCLSYWGILPVLTGLLVLTAVLSKVISYEPPIQAVVEIYLKRSTESFIIFFTLFVALAGPVIEEIFFRGFAYPAVRARFGPWAAMAGTAFVFSALHMSLAAFLPIFFLGMFLAYLYERTGSLVPSMAAHVLHNGIMVFLTLGFKALSS